MHVPKALVGDTIYDQAKGFECRQDDEKTQEPHFKSLFTRTPATTGSITHRIGTSEMKNRVLAAMVLIVSTTTASGAKRPNIVFMMSDDQSRNGLSVAMHPDVPGSKSDLVQTPNLEKLASQGMRFFSAAYAPASVCAPTRISLQLGMSPAALHWTKAAKSVTSHKLTPPTNIRNIPRDGTTMAELLREAGYATAHYGKWHINGGGPGAHGYDEHDGNIGNETPTR